MANLADVTTDLAVKIEQALSVVVARRSSAGELEPRKLTLADSAATSFRDLGRGMLALLQGRAVLPYHADAELDSDEVFLLDDAETLRELSDLRDLAKNAATLPTSAPNQLDVSISLYAVVAGDSDRIAMVRRVDPKIKYKAGGFLAIAGERLTRLEEPAFSFSPGFDLIVSNQWAVVLNQSSFERLYRDIGLIERHIDDWVAGITDNLPMTGPSIKNLRAVAVRDSRTWRKLREIRRRGHLVGVTIADVRDYATKMGLDPDAIVEDNQLVFDPEERFSFLHLLNEDLYKGPLTDETFEAQRKSPTGT